MKLKGIIGLILFSLLAQILLLTLSLNYEQHPDVRRHLEWVRISHLEGAGETYKAENITYGDKPNNLPPSTIYTLTTAYKAELVTSRAILKLSNREEGSILWLNLGYLSFVFLRIPSIASNLLIGLLIYLLAKKYVSEKQALMASGFYLLNPVPLYNAAFWGQIDSINNLFLVGAIFFFILKRTLISILMIAFSLSYKLTILPLIPFIASFYLLSTKLRNLMTYSVIALTLLLIISLPISRDPLWFVDLVLNSSGGELKIITATAFNFWWAIFHPANPSLVPDTSKLFMGISIGIWGYILFTISITPLLFLMLKMRKRILTPSNIFLTLSLVSLMFFLFLPKMHERYLFTFFPLFAGFIGLSNKGKALFAALSLLHLFNLVSGWHPFLSTESEIAMIENADLRWLASLLTLGAAGLIYLKSFSWFKS